MKTLKVVAAIIKKNNKILIAQRNKGEFMGLWEFPGGKIEVEETAEQAIKREIREELAVNININKYLMTAKYDYLSFRLDMKCFICSLMNDEFILNDHLAVKWIDINIELDRINWVPADIQVMKAIKKQYIKSEDNH